MRRKPKARAQDEAFAVQPGDSISKPLLPACNHFGNDTAASCPQRRLRNGAVVGLQFVIFRTSAFLRRSTNAMAVRSGPSPAERQVSEPFARVTEPAHQI